MSIFDFLGIELETKRNLVYRSELREVGMEPTRGEAQGHFKIRDSWSNKSKVYVKINGKNYTGTFKVIKDSCIIGHWKLV